VDIGAHKRSSSRENIGAEAIGTTTWLRYCVFITRRIARTAQSLGLELLWTEGSTLFVQEKHLMIGTETVDEFIRECRSYVLIIYLALTNIVRVCSNFGERAIPW
jgi:hypothetical protein